MIENQYSSSVNPLVALNVRMIYNERALEMFPGKSKEARGSLVNSVFEHVEENNFRTGGILRLWGEWTYD